MIDEGVKGYFKGIIPPLWGSTVYRALMLGAYEFAFTYFSQNYEENHWINQDYMGGIRPVVLASAFFASTVRSCGIDLFRPYLVTPILLSYI